MTAVRVAGVGLRSTLDAATNRAAAVKAVHSAADEGARLVVLPEYAARFDPRGVGLAEAEPLDGPFVAALVDAAAARGVVVVAGTVVGAEADRAANVVVAVDGSGLLGSYRKVHLYDAFGQRESDRFVAGDPAAPPLVLAVDELRVGVLTCYDLRFPESARRLVDAGAELLLVPAAWAAGEHKADQWRTLLRARAIENTAYVLGVPMLGRGLAGDLLLVDPAGVVVAESPARTAGAVPVVAEVDREVVDRVRGRNPSLDNRRYRVVPRG